MLGRKGPRLFDKYQAKTFAPRYYYAYFQYCYLNTFFGTNKDDLFGNQGLLELKYHLLSSCDHKIWLRPGNTLRRD